MNTTKGNRLHIGFFGKRNAGKSSLVNKIIGQELSIVSKEAGTTTDVNQKAMELLPIGPVLLMDTAGVDDIGELGQKRVEKTEKALNRTDVAVVVLDNPDLSEEEIKLLQKINNLKIKTLIILNKTDVVKFSDEEVEKIKPYGDLLISLSALKDENITAKFKEALIKILPEEFVNQTPILSDIVTSNDVAILVIPIDKEAPKGRIILPQVNVLRDMLDNNSISIVCTENKLQEAIGALNCKPKIVVTDSQAFKKVSEIVPKEIPLTSFSILFARLKGDLKTFIRGAEKLDDLKDGDCVLVLESCSHHPVEDDIGRVKIPNLVKKYTGKNINFSHYSGHDFPVDISKYSLIIHCGGCMTNRREILNRINKSLEGGVSITNYGIAIAKCLGILNRVVEPFEI